MSNETHSTLIHINSKSVQEYSVWMQRLVEFLDGKIILVNNFNKIVFNQIYIEIFQYTKNLV